MSDKAVGGGTTWDDSHVAGVTTSFPFERISVGDRLVKVQKRKRKFLVIFVQVFHFLTLDRLPGALEMREVEIVNLKIMSRIVFPNSDRVSASSASGITGMSSERVGSEKNIKTGEIDRFQLFPLFQNRRFSFRCFFSRQRRGEDRNRARMRAASLEWSITAILLFFCFATTTIEAATPHDSAAGRHALSLGTRTRMAAISRRTPTKRQLGGLFPIPQLPGNPQPGTSAVSSSPVISTSPVSPSGISSSVPPATATSIISTPVTTPTSLSSSTR